MAGKFIFGIYFGLFFFGLDLVSAVTFSRLSHAELNGLNACQSVRSGTSRKQFSSQTAAPNWISQMSL